MYKSTSGQRQRRKDKFRGVLRKKNKGRGGIRGLLSLKILTDFFVFRRILTPWGLDIANKI